MRGIELRLATLVIAAILLLSLSPQVLPNFSQDAILQDLDLPDDVIDESLLNFEADFNLTNDYQKFWEPNNIQGSSRAVAVSESNNFMAVAGGWMNDAELHIYRWLEISKEYVQVWDSGDAEFGGDITDIEFMDCDNNGRLEIVAACQDGLIYIYEALGIEDDSFYYYEDCNIFEQVWNSSTVMDQQVWDIELNDIDHDSHTEIIAANWDGKVYVFDYIDHSAWPYCQEEHWIEFELVWDSGDVISDRVNTVVVGDTDQDMRSEIIAGSQDGKVYLFEEKPCLHHVYELRWTSGDAIWRPINAIAYSTSFDGDYFGEFAVSAYGQGLYVFHYDYATDDYYVKKINRQPALWELGATATNPLAYTGYEVDPYIDRKDYGWTAQGVLEIEPILYPWNTTEIGGNTSMGGPPDDSCTYFNASEQMVPLGSWDYEIGNGTNDFKYPLAMAVAPDGTIFVTDNQNDRVRRLTADGEPMFNFGETGNETGQFDGPAGIAIDDEGFVYISDTLNSRIQKFTLDGEFVASWGENGSEFGQFYFAWGLAIGPGDLLYVADSGNNRIVSLNRTTGEFLDMIEPTGAYALDTPTGLSVDQEGNIYVCDSLKHRIIAFTPEGWFEVQWGSGGTGPGQFNQPLYSTITDDGIIYVSDWANSRVQKFTLDGEYIGEFGGLGFEPDQFAGTTGIAIDSRGQLLVCDYLGVRIQNYGVLGYPLIDVIGGTYPGTGGLGGPYDVGQGPDGCIYVTDYPAHLVVKYANNGTYLMNWTLPSNHAPVTIQVEDDNRVFVSDYTSHMIHVFDYNGTLRYSFGEAGSGPGQFNGVWGMTSEENLLYICDYNNDRIQIFDKNGTFIDVWGISGANPGEMNSPCDLAIGPDGLLYIVEYSNDRVSIFMKNGTYVDLWDMPSGIIYPRGILFDNDGYIHISTTYDGLLTYTSEHFLLQQEPEAFYNYEETFDISSGRLCLMDFADDGTIIIPDNANGKVLRITTEKKLDFVAEAIVDFGIYEEMAGDATPAFDGDIYIPLTEPDPATFEISISQDGVTFAKIPFNHTYAYFISGYGYSLRFDIDYTLRTMGWTNARYMKIGVKGNQLIGIDAARINVDRPVDTAMCMIAGQVHTSTGVSNYEEIIIGTVDGQILAYNIAYDTWLGTVAILESYSDTPKFALDGSIRDIIQLDNERGRMPSWKFDEVLLYGTDVTGINFERFQSWTFFDPDEDGDHDIAAVIDRVGTPYLLYFENNNDDENPAYSRVNGYFTTYCNVSLEVLTNVAYASITAADVNDDGDEDLVLVERYWTGVTYTYRMLFLEKETYEYFRVWPQSEVSNQFFGVTQAIQNADFVSRMSFYDMDYDGDVDLTIGAEELLYFEQTTTGSYMTWLQNFNYYRDINDDQTNVTVFGKLGFHDYDYDYDIDVTVSHGWENYTYNSQIPEASMLSYYENIGTVENPVWEKNRRIYEPDFRGTPISPGLGCAEPNMIDMNGDNIPDLGLMREQNLTIYHASLDHDIFLTATYPYVHLVEVEKKKSAPGFYGFEVHDSWDNSERFEQWTMCVEIADTDEDGITEVIVGSMDQNIYTFEQVANNTYRRAWRSPDLFSIRSTGKDLIPFWNDVESMAIGDQDRDGKQEIIVVAGVEVLIFENTQNDMYELVWSQYWIDWGESMTHYIGPSAHELSVVAVDKDLDDDGRSEILLGGDELLLIFECVGDNNYTAVWGIDFSLLPRENGEPIIHAIHTNDFDGDGNRGFAVAGSDTTFDNWGNVIDEEGWAYVFENKDHEDNVYELRYFYIKWNDGAYDIDSADHDFDGLSEIFVAHASGIQMVLPGAAYSLGVVIPTLNASHAVKAGNTDGDSWMELIVGAGPYIVVFEQNMTYPRSAHHYDMVWNTTELRDDVTDIEIGDTDNDDILEIIASAAMGSVYAYEFRPNVSATAEALLAEFSLSYESETPAPDNPEILVAVQPSTVQLQRRFDFE